MRFISHILRFVGYVTLLPYLAYLMSASFGSCMAVPVGLVEVLFPVITFIFIIGYGDLLRLKKPWDSPVTFWVANVIFYGFFASLVIRIHHDGLFSSVKSKFSSFYEAFVPEYQPYQALDAVGGLSFVTLRVWIPVAALLSIIALAVTVRQNRHQDLNATEGLEPNKARLGNPH